MNAAPPAASRRIALVFGLLAAIAVGLPAVIRVASDQPSTDRLHLGGTAPARVAARWPGLVVQDITVERGGGQPFGTVRVGVAAPPGTPAADLLFFHGHSDRMDNHQALFTAWRDSGVRVISFDLPDHGGTAAGSLDTWSLDRLVELGSRIEARTREDRRRPLLLGGFSTGGELCVHAVVHPDLLAQFGRRPVGLVLLSPALAVLPFTGGDGVSRARALTHPGGAELAAPAPALPLANPLFAGSLLVESRIDRTRTPPHDISLLVITADPADDAYIDVAAVQSWAVRVATADVRVDALACPGSRHGVDNEAWPTGSDVAAASGAYVAGVLGGTAQPVVLRNCRAYQRALLDASITS